MSNFKLVFIVALFSGSMNSCEQYSPPVEIVPEAEENIIIEKEKPIKIKLKRGFGYA